MMTRETDSFDSQEGGLEVSLERGLEVSLEGGLEGGRFTYAFCPRIICILNSALQEHFVSHSLRRGNPSKLYFDNIMTHRHAYTDV